MDCPTVVELSTGSKKSLKYWGLFVNKILTCILHKIKSPLKHALSFKAVIKYIAFKKHSLMSQTLLTALAINFA